MSSPLGNIYPFLGGPGTHGLPRAAMGAASSPPGMPSLPLPRGSGPVEVQGPSEGPQAPGQVVVLRAWFNFSDVRKIAWLRKFAEQYGREPQMRFFVVDHVLRHDPTMQRDYAKQAAALLSWVQQNVLYLNETGEVIQNPWVTIRKKVGDCDDVAILLASMATAIALPWRFVLAGRNKSTGQPVRWFEPVNGRGPSPPRNVDWAHIYVAFGDKPFNPQVWTPAEPTIKGAPLGYDPVLHGPLADTHMRGRWTGRLPELSGPGLGATPAATAPASEGWNYKDEARDVLRDSLKFGISGAISGIITAWLLSKKKHRKS